MSNERVKKTDGGYKIGDPNGKHCATILSETTTQALSKMFFAAKQCYSNDPPENLFEEMMDFSPQNLDNMVGLIRRVLDMGHESILEHVSLTFFIHNVSRSMTYQLVRHRIATYIQQSQRRVDCANFGYVTPPSISNDATALEHYNELMEHIKEEYSFLVSRGIPKEDARFVLPNACHTRLVATVNLRSLMNFFSLRLCQKAQWEIRELAFEMFMCVRTVFPFLIEYFGPKCVKTHFCSESGGCGLFPPKKAVWNLIEEKYPSTTMGYSQSDKVN